MKIFIQLRLRVKIEKDDIVLSLNGRKHPREFILFNFIIFSFAFVLLGMPLPLVLLCTIMMVLHNTIDSCDRLLESYLEIVDDERVDPKFIHRQSLSDIFLFKKKSIGVISYRYLNA